MLSQEFAISSQEFSISSQELAISSQESSISSQEFIINSQDLRSIVKNSRPVVKNLQSTVELTKKGPTSVRNSSNSSQLTHVTNNIKLSRQLFSSVLKEIGWSQIEPVLPMFWTKILSIRNGAAKGKNKRPRCDALFHPDHFLSKVILENLINRQSINPLMQTFCSKRMRKAALHFVQSDDVISGITVLSFQEDGSVVALVNVGF
eukprot:gene5420-6098_t